MNNDNERLEEYLTNWYEKIAVDDYAGRMFFAKARNQFDKISAYGSFLEEIDNRAKTMTKVSIFADKESFVYRSILRTPFAYKHLKGIQPVLINSRPITATTDSMYTDLLAFLLIFLLTMLLLLNEKDRGLFALLRPARNGRAQLIIAKILVIYTACIVVFFLLYAGKYCISAVLYGSCDLSKVIQSVEGFIGSTLKISIRGYLIIFSLTKIAAYFFIASILTFLCIIAKTGLFVYVTGCVYSIISSLFYVLINANSYLSILKFINPVCLIDTNVLYKNYIDLNLFGQPINLLRTGIFMLVFGNLIFIIVNVFIFTKQKNLIFHHSKVIRWLLNNFHIRRKAPASLWSYEAYKIIVVNKGLLIILAVVLLGWNSYQSYQMPFFMNDSIYKYYINQVEGPIEAKTYEYIENEKARYQKIRDDLAFINEQFREGKFNSIVYENLSRPYSLELAREVGFYMLQEKVHMLEPFYERNDSIRPWLVYDTGYNQLLGVLENEDLKYAHLIFLVSLIACIAPIYSVENAFGAKRLLMTTPRGRLHSLYRRLGVGAVVTTLLFIAAYLPGVINILKSYGTGGIAAPVQSITGYQSFPLSISIAGFICLLYALRLLTAILMLMLVLSISFLSKNLVLALSLATVCFLAPYVIMLMGLNFVAKIGWNPNIIIYNYFMNATIDGKQYIMIINFIIIVVISIYVFRKTYLNIKNAN